eukprot:scaffold9866_cov108-Isochrysis_galbana.AAC.4
MHTHAHGECKGASHLRVAAIPSLLPQQNRMQTCPQQQQAWHRTRPHLLRSQRVPGVCRQGQQQLASAQASAASEGWQRRVVPGVRAGVPCRLLCRVPPLREGLRRLGHPGPAAQEGQVFLNPG